MCTPKSPFLNVLQKIQKNESAKISPPKLHRSKFDSWGQKVLILTDLEEPYHEEFALNDESEGRGFKNYDPRKSDNFCTQNHKFPPKMSPP